MVKLRTWSTFARMIYYVGSTYTSKLLSLKNVQLKHGAVEYSANII